MKTSLLLVSLAATTIAIWAQPSPQPRPARPMPVRAQADTDAKPPQINYEIRLRIEAQREEPREITLVTTEGTFDLSGALPKGAKIDENEVPLTVSFNGTLNALAPDKCRLQFHFGRTIPFVSGYYDTVSGPGNTPVRRSQMQQVNVGIQTAVVLTSGKPVVVKDDGLERLTLTLRRLEE